MFNYFRGGCTWSAFIKKKGNPRTFKTACVFQNLRTFYRLTKVPDTLSRFLQFGKYVNCTMSGGVEWARERGSPEMWWGFDLPPSCASLVISLAHCLPLPFLLPFVEGQRLDREVTGQNWKDQLPWSWAALWQAEVFNFQNYTDLFRLWYPLHGNHPFTHWLHEDPV